MTGLDLELWIFADRLAKHAAKQARIDVYAEVQKAYRSDILGRLLTHGWRELGEMDATAQAKFAYRCAYRASINAMISTPLFGWTFAPTSRNAS